MDFAQEKLAFSETRAIAWAEIWQFGWPRNWHNRCHQFEWIDPTPNSLHPTIANRREAGVCWFQFREIYFGD